MTTTATEVKEVSQTSPAEGSPAPSGETTKTETQQTEQTIPVDRFHEYVGKNQQLTREVEKLRGELKEAKQIKEQPKEPTLSDFDYDDDKFQQAQTEFRLSKLKEDAKNEALAEIRNEQKQSHINNQGQKFQGDLITYARKNAEFTQDQQKAVGIQPNNAVMESILETSGLDNNGDSLAVRTLHELYKSPGDLNALNGMSKSQIDRALGLLQGRILSEQKADKTVTPSNAPKPMAIERGGGGAPTPELNSPNLSANDWYSEYNKKVAALYG